MSRKEIMAMKRKEKEDNIISAFAVEMEQFGLKVNTRSRGGQYIFDEKLRQDIYFLNLRTEPFPVAGNKKKMDEIVAAGYTLIVYVPYGWNRRRGFIVIVNRPLL